MAIKKDWKPPVGTGRLSGRPSRYQPKNRNKTISVALTDEGRELLDEQRATHGLSRPDYIESLVRGELAPRHNQ
jgi:hypothetical protein